MGPPAPAPVVLRRRAPAAGCATGVTEDPGHLRSTRQTGRTEGRGGSWASRAGLRALGFPPGTHAGSGSSAALRRARHRADGYNLATCWRRLATTSHQHAPHQGSSHCQQDTPHPSGSVQMLPTRRGSPEAVDDACVHRGPPSRLWAALQPRMDAMQGCERVRGPPHAAQSAAISDQIKWPS